MNTNHANTITRRQALIAITAGAAGLASSAIFASCQVMQAQSKVLAICSLKILAINQKNHL